MAIALTSDVVRQLQNGTSTSFDRSGSFGASVVASLAMFGLAASGMCVAVLAQPCPLVSKGGPAAER